MAEYEGGITQMIHEMRVIFRRLQGETGASIAADLGKGKKYPYDVQRRALARLGYATLADYRPHQLRTLQAVRETCRRIANTPGAAQRVQAISAYAATNIMLQALDDTITVDPVPPALGTTQGEPTFLVQ